MKTHPIAITAISISISISISLLHSHALAAAASSAFGQANAHAPAAAAVAADPTVRPAPAPESATPPAVRPTPRLLSPAESRDSARPAGELRPERPVTPQISIPFGKSPRATDKPPARQVRRGATPASGGIDDGAARCEAQPDAAARARCRDKLAREAPAQAPN
jgi:hypothetical protein